MTACTRRWPRHLSVAWRRSGLIKKNAGRAALRPGHAGPWWCCVRQRVGVHRWRWTDIGLKASGVRTRFRWRTSRPTRSVCGFLRTGCAHSGRKNSSTNREGSDRNSPNCAIRLAAYERESPRKWRAQKEAALARLSRLCDQDRSARDHRGGERAAARQLSARCHEMEYEQFSGVCVPTRTRPINSMASIEVSKKFWIAGIFARGRRRHRTGLWTDA